VKIIISDIPEKGLELELLETIESDATLKILSPVHGFIKIDRKDSEVLVRGFADVVIEQQCSRCLKVFNVDLRVNIDTVYRPSQEINVEEHYELKSDEMETGFYKNDVIELDDLLKEQFMLNLPMKPLCFEQCKGLCPKCGTDLNISECSCEASEIDSRLLILKQLLNRKE
jgi:uncharacterized protein